MPAAGRGHRNHPWSVLRARRVGAVEARGDVAAIPPGDRISERVPPADSCGDRRVVDRGVPAVAPRGAAVPGAREGRDGMDLADLRRVVDRVTYCALTETGTCRETMNLTGVRLRAHAASIKKWIPKR
eukprot:gene11744-biopygen11124